MKGKINLPALTPAAKRALAATAIAPPPALAAAPMPESMLEPTPEMLRLIEIEPAASVYALVGEAYAEMRRLASAPRRPSFNVVA
jgi:hypothetical protein